MWKIPLSDLDFDEREVEAVAEVIRSKWLTLGEVTHRFENAFAELVGVRHAIAVTNCTAALQLAYRVLGVEPGTEVIMPALTFVATANAAVVEGGEPIFADIIGEDDLTISPESIARAITPRTRVITVVHYAGYPCHMDAIMAIARARKLAVVEDCAHSPGATYRGQATGAIGDVGCFSFFSNKNIATGEGGMITTNRDDLAERIRLLRSHGMTTLTLDRHLGHSFSYDVVDAGYNARIDEMRSALGLVQLSKLEAGNTTRRRIVAAYRRGLAGSPQITLPFAAGSPDSSCRDAESACHIMPAVLAPVIDRERFMTAMRDGGIQTSIHYPPIHRFSQYHDARSDSETLRVTDALAPRLVTLPLYPAMTAGDIDLVLDACRRSLRAASPLSTQPATVSDGHPG